MTMEADPNPIDQHTTAILLSRVRIGDKNARNLLIARVEPLLRRFAHGRLPQLLRHEQDTADLVQHTWLKVLERLELIETARAGDFFAYLRMALINGLRESLRRVKLAPVRTFGIPVGVENEQLWIEQLPAEDVDPTDWIAYEQALQSLSPLHRNLVLMRFEFGMSFVEIATELGETPNGVRMKIGRALERMSITQKDAEGDPPPTANPD